MRDPLIIIGAQRSGTTYLYHVLDRHPEVRMAKPIRPEPKFFMDPKCVSRGKRAYFEELFAPSPTEGILYGEKSTSYIEFPEVAERIHRLFPNAHLLALLRDPVERAISNYRFSVDNGLETRSLREALLQEKPPPKLKERPSVDPFTYLQRGHYAEQLRPFLDRFGEQLHIHIAERFLGEPGTVQKLYQDLGLSKGPEPMDVRERVNASEADTEMEDEALKPELQEHFRPHIEELEKLLGLDLNIWKG